MEVNEHLIKVSASSIPIGTELKMGDEVSAMIQGDVVKIEDTDNQDGTINRTYVIKGILATTMANKEKPTKQIKTSSPFKY